MLQKSWTPGFSDFGKGLHLYDFLLNLRNNNTEILDSWIADFGKFLLCEFLLKFSQQQFEFLDFPVLERIFLFVNSFV